MHGLWFESPTKGQRLGSLQTPIAEPVRHL